jgi:hypothetical protein
MLPLQPVLSRLALTRKVPELWVLLQEPLQERTTHDELQSLLPNALERSSRQLGADTATPECGGNLCMTKGDLSGRQTIAQERDAGVGIKLEPIEAGIPANVG